MPDLGLTAASASARPGDVFYDFTINRGCFGISAGDAVITEMGVVGVVEEVSATSSRVRSILRRRRRIGATKTGENGGSRAHPVCEQRQGALNYLTRGTQVQPGDRHDLRRGRHVPERPSDRPVDSVERSNADSSFYAIVRRTSM